MRIIEICFADGDVSEVGNIPDDAKITFAQLNPAASGDRFGGGGLTLRIYKGSRDNGNQLAVFRNVESFRDLTLSVSVKEKKSFI